MSTPGRKAKQAAWYQANKTRLREKNRGRASTGARNYLAETTARRARRAEKAARGECYRCPQPRESGRALCSSCGVQNSARTCKLQRTNLAVKMRKNLRNRLGWAVGHGQKAGSAVRDLGCTIPELRAHLEAQFQPGMTWEDWSTRGWHIDHIQPLSSFDLTDREQFLKACHYTNLQPLWAEENLKKSAKAA